MFRILIARQRVCNHVLPEFSLSLKAWRGCRGGVGVGCNPARIFCLDPDFAVALSRAQGTVGKILLGMCESS